MEPNPGQNEWDGPAHGYGPEPRRRAATLVWVLSAIEVAFFGFCSAFFFAVRTIPLERLQAEFTQQHQQANIPQLNEFYPLLGGAAVTLLILGFLPGVAYALLAFGVRAGRGLAIHVTLLLAGTQFLAFALLFITGAFNDLRIGNLPGLTGDILLFGTVLITLGFTITWLLRAKMTLSPATTPDQPWNRPPG